LIEKERKDIISCENGLQDDFKNSLVQESFIGSSFIFPGYHLKRTIMDCIFMMIGFIKKFIVESFCLLQESRSSQFVTFVLVAVTIKFPGVDYSQIMR